MLTLKNLTVQSNNCTLLNDISLEIHSNAINAIVGPSGSGKSLIARSIVGRLGQLKHTNYEVTLHGDILTNLSDVLGKKIGMITQDYSNSFNAHHKLGKQLIRIYRYHNRTSKKEAKKRVIHALSHVNLNAKIMNQYRFNLSGGQLQRVQIASVLMLNPDLIIADEITSSLDRITAQRIMEIIQHVAKDHNQTFLMITHDISHVENYADYITVIKDGNLIETGKREEIKTSRNPFVKEIMTKLKVRNDFND